MGFFDRFKKQEPEETYTAEQVQEASAIFENKLKEAWDRASAEVNEHYPKMDYSFLNEYSAFLEIEEFVELQDSVITNMVYCIFKDVIASCSIMTADDLVRSLLTVPRISQFNIPSNIADLSVFDVFDRMITDSAFDKEEDIGEQLDRIQERFDEIRDAGTSLGERWARSASVFKELKDNTDPEFAITELTNLLLSDWSTEKLLDAKLFLILLAYNDETAPVSGTIELRDGRLGRHSFEMYFDVPYSMYFTLTDENDLYFPSGDYLIAQAVYAGEHEDTSYDLDRDCERFIGLLKADETYIFAQSVLAVHNAYSYYDQENIEKVWDKLSTYMEE